MKAPELISADLEGIGVERWIDAGAQPGGAQRLQRLCTLLDKPWFCRRHNAAFEMRTHGQDQVVYITKAGQPAATWSERDRVLVFTPLAGGEEERAETLECAISITCDFLDHARTKPAMASGAGRRNGAH
jgi:hypothetical protein